MILVAFISAKEEVYATYPYRMNIAPKGAESRKYHIWGAIHIAILCSALPFISLLYSYNLGLLTFLGILDSLWYWLLFDIFFALLIQRKWYYLGNESIIDRTLKRILGVDEGGKTKAYIVAGLIVIINVICLIFVV